MKISTIIVDDEAHARQAMQHLLKAHPQIDVLAECENGLAAVKAVNELQPELMFLDIQMPKLDGLDVLDLLGDAAPLTVFVTAHDEYAIKAFEKNALDYLLKPVSRERLASTIERLAQRNLQPEAQQQQRETLLSGYHQQQSPVSRVLVREKGDVFVIPVESVLAIEAADDYVVIHTPERKHIKQERLSKLEQILDANQFCRIHRSTIINLDHLAGIENDGKDNKLATMKNQQQFSISRSGYSKLIEIL
ncbi:two component transcriptional regulator, LytTR family [Alteromonadaceae bacterium Bs31]|nr:two component transcriptional regulator, LytTR family [Alteromonadaceae bacterium Bs31]